LSGWCNGLQNFLSASVINAQLPNLYRSKAGLVLSPVARVMCYYSFDGGTQGKRNGGCGQRWCSRSWWWGCAWPPDQLQPMLETQRVQNSAGYNEVVVDSAFWHSHLPEVIEAVVAYDAGQADTARQVHRDFVRFYGGAVAHVPLVLFDVRNSEHPFTELVR